MIKKTDAKFNELKEMLEKMIDAYSPHGVALAFMQICDDKAEHVAMNWQDVTLAKHWARCADAAAMLEAVTLKEFGE